MEDLGGGLKATGVIDNRLDTANTARNTGDMFAKVEGGFGTVQIGQYTFASHAGWNAGASRTVSALSTTAQTLSSSVIAYTTPSISGLTASVGYDFDTSATGAGKNGWGLKANYATGPLAAQLSYTIAAKAVETDTAAKVTGLAASYDLGVAKVFYNQTDVRAGKNSAGTALNARKGMSLSVTVPMGAATVKAGLMNNKIDTDSKALDRSMIGIDYALSKRTTLVAEFGQDKQAVTGASRVNNSFVGINHSF